MDFTRRWTPFALDAEVNYYGTKRIADAHNHLRDEHAKLYVIVAAAQKCVDNLAWAGVCDEDVELEQALRKLKEEGRREP